MRRMRLEAAAVTGGGADDSVDGSEDTTGR